MGASTEVVPESGSDTRRPRRRWLAAGVLTIAAIGIGLVAEEWRARRAFRHGLALLMAGDATSAREYLDRSQPFWRSDPEVDFRSAQAARRARDSAAAIGHLLDAEQNGWPTPAVEIERALIAADNGVPFTRLEAILRGGTTGDPVSARDAMTALTVGYVGQFRIVEAEGVTADWVARRPDDPAAWRARADVLERLVRREAARDAYARWVELAPHEREARLGLVRMLLETQAAVADILVHIDQLEADGGNDPDFLRYKARTQIVAGRLDEAAATLDRAIAGPSPHATALMERAKLDMDRDQPAAAVTFARRAVAADAGDPEVLYTLFRCLLQAGAREEATEVEARWKRVNADLTRVNELGKLISAAPFDPNLRREMGELFLRNGREAEGLRWLDSALAIRSDHGPTHRVLASYYTQTGQHARAAVHSSQAK